MSQAAPEMIHHLFARWEAPPDDPQAVSFSAPGAAGPDELALWQLDLPGPLEQAQAYLAEAGGQVERAQAALDQIPGRLNRLTGAGPAQEAVSFSGPTFQPELPPPEADLLAALDNLRAGTSQAEVSFGLGDRLGDLNRAREAVQAFLARTQRLIQYQAYIKTSQENRLIGQTVVDWSGDLRTAWAGGLRAEQAELHQRSLGVALSSRQTMLKTATLAVTGAAKIITMISTTGGVGTVLALPLAWKYINQILNEIKQHQHIATE